MQDFEFERKKLETLYEICKELTRSEVEIVKSNARRMVGLVRITLAEVSPDRIIEHPVDFE